MKMIKGLKTFERVILSLVMIAMIIVLAGGLIWLSKPAHQNAEAAVYYSQDVPGIQSMTFSFPRVYTTSTAGVAIHTFYAPYKMRVLEFGGIARLLSFITGTESYTLDIKEAGTSLLSGAITLHQNTLGVGTISDTSIAAGARVDIMLATAGTSVSCTDLTSVLTYQRTN